MRPECEINEIIKKMFSDDSYNRGASKLFNRQYPDIVEWLRNRYSVDGSYSSSELCYCYVNGISEIPKCSCGGKVRFKGFMHGYGQYCSGKCRYSDKEAQERAKKVRDETTIKKYGVRNVFLLKSMQDKAKATKLEKYGDIYYSNHEKAKRTCLERYGCESPGGSDEIRERIRESFMSRFGVTSPFGLESTKEKSRKTMLSRYGVEYSAQNPLIYQKVKETNRKKYGHECVLESEEVRKKSVETTRSKYGVDFYSQTREYHIKRRHKFHSRIIPEKTFYSSWEAIVYDYCMSRGVEPVVAPCAITFDVDGTKHTYIPDFMINGHLVEIKGNQFIEEDGTWKIPFRRGKFRKDVYERIMKQAKAKSECARENNVVVISEDEMKDLDSSLGKLIEGSSGPGMPMPDLNTHGLSYDDVVNICSSLEFPGTKKFNKDHFVWRCNVKGRKPPIEAWKDIDCISAAVRNLFKSLQHAIAKGTENEFIVTHEGAFMMAAEGDVVTLAQKVLSRFTIARIAPKVTTLPSSLFINDAKASGIDMSSGVYCPMAGFGGIVRGAKELLEDIGVYERGKIYAADINPYLCRQYGWENKDVLSDFVETDKVVVACPPFEDKEIWPGTPDSMYRPFEEWTYLIREHVKAPRYIFFGPVTEIDRSMPNLFSRNKQARYYPEFSYPL